MIRPLIRRSRYNQRQFMKPTLIFVFFIVTAPLFSQESQTASTVDTGVLDKHCTVLQALSQTLATGMREEKTMPTFRY